MGEDRTALEQSALREKQLEVRQCGAEHLALERLLGGRQVGRRPPIFHQRLGVCDSCRAVLVHLAWLRSTFRRQLDGEPVLGLL